MVESLAELPPNILSDILSRLPIKNLLACRSVCKTFLNITSSNPYFNSLHSSNTAQNLIIRLGEVYKPTRLVHLVDSELDTAFGFGEKVKLKLMFQIPKYPGKYFERYHVCSGKENNFVMVNSYNGLLYFAERTACERAFICNPITNEYVTLLEFDEERNRRQLTMGLWFGFSSKENQYKVLRIFSTLTGKPWEIGFKQEFWAQIHVIDCVHGEISKISHRQSTLRGIHVLLFWMELFIGSANIRSCQSSYSSLIFTKKNMGKFCLHLTLG